MTGFRTFCKLVCVQFWILSWVHSRNLVSMVDTYPEISIVPGISINLWKCTWEILLSACSELVDTCSFVVEKNIIWNLWCIKQLNTGSQNHCDVMKNKSECLEQLQHIPGGGSYQTRRDLRTVSVDVGEIAECWQWTQVSTVSFTKALYLP